jgi:hypothetical protein
VISGSVGIGCVIRRAALAEGGAGEESEQWKHD